MKPSLSFTQTNEIVAFVESFENCSLPKPCWTHAAHLVVGLWHVLHYPPDEALNRLRHRIRVYNEASGVANTDRGGYHETVTRFFVTALGEFLAAHPPEQRELPDLVAALLSSPLADKEFPLRYYSRELLFSVQARREWVEPDLR